MSTGGSATGERLPRRGRYLIPKTTPRRAEIIAAGGVAVVLAHLLFAQLTFLLAIVFHAITKVSRWRPQWLAVPAAIGLIWMLAIGPAAAARGLVAGPREIMAYLGGVSGTPGRVLHLGGAYAGLSGWLPRQLPLALITGAAEAALAAWLTWLHTDEWRLTAPRPGLVSAIRRRYVARQVRRGAVVTRDGACLGIAMPGGGRAALSWREAAGGLLCAGAPGSGTTTTSFQLVHAAIRRRKPVIAVDLSGGRQLAEWFAIVCGAVNAPLSVLSVAGPGYYEPLREGDPIRRTALVMGMIDWAGTADQYRRSCGGYLNDLFAVTDAAPGDPGVPVLDEVAHLLNPAALRARVEHVPGFHPQRASLIERVKVSASLFEADPQTSAALTAQLSELRAAPICRWLAPAPARAHAPSAAVDLGRTLRQRGVVLFSLGGMAGRTPAMVAGLVAQDCMAICAELRAIGVAGDGLLWFTECGGFPAATLAELVKRGASADVATVLTTTSAAAADRLAHHVNAVVIHRMADPVMAERFARITGDKLVPEHGALGGPLTPGRAHVGGARAGLVPSVAAPAAPGYGAPAGAATALAGAQWGEGLTFVRKPTVAPEVLFGLGKGEFVLVVQGAVRSSSAPAGVAAGAAAGLGSAPPLRLVPLGKTIPARLHVAPKRAAAHTWAPALDRIAVPAVPHPRQPLRNRGGDPGTGGAPDRRPVGNGPTRPADHGSPPTMPGVPPGPPGQPGPGHAIAGDRAPGPSPGVAQPAPARPAAPGPPRLSGTVPDEFPEKRPWPT